MAGGGGLSQTLHCLGGMRFAAPRICNCQVWLKLQSPPKSTRSPVEQLRKSQKCLLEIPRIPKQGYLSPSETCLTTGPWSSGGAGNWKNSTKPQPPPQASTIHNHPYHPLLTATLLLASTLLCTATLCALRCLHTALHCVYAAVHCAASQQPSHRHHQCQSSHQQIRIARQRREEANMDG